MRLDPDQCWERLAAAERAVLATVHAERGTDVVPVVFAVHEGRVVVPVDTVKPKSGTRLQRLENLRRDPRCALLVDHYASDWSALWWVRLHGTAAEAAPSPPVLEALARRYPPYRDPGAVALTIVVTPTAITGWAARPPPTTPRSVG